MYLVIAPNAFKGGLSAEEAAGFIAEGIRLSDLSCKLALAPVADGGDGTATLIAKKMNSRQVKVKVQDPLGRMVDAVFGWVAGEKTAIIEMSEASGYRLLQKEELNPILTNTKGTGQLIQAALDKGAQRILLGVGGSATVDGGTGLLQALGIRFLDEKGNEIIELPRELLRLKTIDRSGLDSRLSLCEIVVLCDVQNTLLGNNGAAAVFGPQKGAGKEAVILLEKCLQQLNKITAQALKPDMASYVYGGAAGGVAAGLAAFVNARLVSGIEFFLDVIGFAAILENADYVITAEGNIDSQTLAGKGPFGVAQKAKNKGIPVIVLAGQVPLKINNELHQYFDVMLPIGQAPASIKDAIGDTAANLTRTAFELGNLIALKQKTGAI